MSSPPIKPTSALLRCQAINTVDGCALDPFVQIPVELTGNCARFPDNSVRYVEVALPWPSNQLVKKLAKRGIDKWVPVLAWVDPRSLLKPDANGLLPIEDA